MFTCEEKLKMLLFFLSCFKLLLPAKTIRDTNVPVSLSIDRENAIIAIIMAKGMPGIILY